MIAMYPSLMAADLLNLRSEISTLEQFCAGFHIDIMDHSFVPNLTWGPNFVTAIRATTKKTLWVDLLVDQPDVYLDTLTLQQNDIVTLHYESKSIHGNHKTIASLTSSIRAKGLIASLAINPETPIEVFAPLLDLIDHAQLMSVNPGFSGSPFYKTTPARITKLQALLKTKNKDLLIGIDGGINQKTFPLIKESTINMIAIGAGVFSYQDRIKALNWYK